MVAAWWCVVARGCDRRELFYRVNMHHGQKLHPGGTRVPLHSAVVSSARVYSARPNRRRLTFTARRQNLRHIFIRTLELAVEFFYVRAADKNAQVSQLSTARGESRKLQARTP
jgi:hypothetical protein